MKPVAFACLSMVFYAFQNVLLEQKLSRYSTVAILLFFYASLFPVALAAFFACKAMGQQVIVPSGAMIWVTIGIGALYFVADSLYISASEEATCLRLQRSSRFSRRSRRS